ncbi:MAG: response regulator [Syntrophobacterales bacterium]|jgi:PAS domain S-box-containing protein|nr:response regulator [Syntrophobacterales bacterium]
MKVGIGYSDNPETNAAGLQAAEMAVKEAGRNDPCDMVLLFSTARHDQYVLREAVASVTGESVPIYGGGTAGIITNEYFGYAGDQIAALCIWLDGVGCEALIVGGLQESEEETGIRLGKQLAALGTKPDSPVMLFYDALDCSNGVRMLMATWLLAGIGKGLGFLPDLAGAGLMGDHACNPTKQWLGDGMGEYSAIALAFSGNIRMDSVIMHGCRPATQYYTVTKAAGPVILEINGKPAIPFIDEILDSAIAPEQYPFFLIFGVNHGERWGDYNEDYYASRLCLGIDKDSGGIVMFEPDMVEGTEFRLMFRSIDLDYIKPKIDKVFDELDGREPVFAVYIDCAGRCAGYGGMDMEDALVIQKTVGGRVPVLGLYTGVEIASIGGSPRGLDWTGVFCLFSQSRDGAITAKTTVQSLWDAEHSTAESKEIPVEAMARLCEQNAAKILALDTASIAIRYELEQKRRGFSLLAELAVSLRQSASYESVFIPAARRINAALNMQRTIVLVPDGKGLFTAEVLQGYPANEKAVFAGHHIEVPPELLDPDNPVLVTGADPADRLGAFREFIGVPFFISSPVILQDEVFAIFITGRLVEAHPYLVRLSRSDMETVQAISVLLASVIAGQRLAVSEERNRIMVDAMPMCCLFRDEKGDLTDCNREALSLFGFTDKNELLEQFLTLSPEYQPDGRHSEKTVRETVKKAFVSGGDKFMWTHMDKNGEIIPTEVTLIRVPKGENYILAAYVRDMREQKAAQEYAERYAKARNEFLASVSHEIRTPMNAIAAMARIASDSKDLYEKQQNIINQGMRSVKLLTSVIETIVDFSRLDSGQLSLESVEFSVRELMEDISNIARSETGKKSLSFHASVDGGVPESLFGDPARLQQALLNVVMNAIKFTEAGGVEIHALSEKPDQDNVVSLIFEVRDTGIGITDDQMADLFKPMYTMDSTYTRKYGGLGMGLPVTNGLVMLMGGEITCESRPGEGSVFRLIIPLTLPEKKAAAAEMLKKKADLETLQGMRVLVAEDNDINQMIMEELLSSVGVEVTMANNGIEALAILSEESFDVVLMDIQMPEMDGLTATSQIRADLRYDGLPVLAMTANGGPEHLAESMSAGMNDHLTKPIDVDQLYKALKKWGKR